MRRKYNTGFSMVEILIGVAIFSILLVPIVQGIISSLKMSTESKELQYRNEFANNMLEYVDLIPVDKLTDKTYFEKSGTIKDTFTYTYTPKGGLFDEEGNPVKCGVYTLSGETEIGTTHEIYNYEIQLDNTSYAERSYSEEYKDAGIQYVDPNNLQLGIVEDIDHTKVALIDGTILNMDKEVYANFTGRKLAYAKENDEVRYGQHMEGNINIFARDTVVRSITVEVSDISLATSSEKEYMVRCIMDYVETSSYLKDEERHDREVPYTATFKGELPNIYLMYNPCFYNGNYCEDDYITVDVTGLNPDEQPEVNLFVVEIAEDYSKNIIDSGSLTEDDKDRTFVIGGTDVKDGIYREDVNVHLAGVVDAKNSNSGDLKTNVNIYHNFGDNYASDDDKNNGIKSTNVKTDAEKFWYNSEAAGTVVDANMTKLATYMNRYQSDKIYSFIDMDGVKVLPLKYASEASRGLYEVKIWLKAKSQGAIDSANEDPIIIGTKGGNES